MATKKVAKKKPAHFRAIRSLRRHPGRLPCTRLHATYTWMSRPAASRRSRSRRLPRALRGVHVECAKHLKQAISGATFEALPFPSSIASRSRVALYACAMAMMRGGRRHRGDEGC